MRSAFVAASVAVVALLGAAPAIATELSSELFHPSGADLRAAIDVARAYWGTPACGEPRFGWQGTVSAGAEAGEAHSDACSFTVARADAAGSFTPGGFCLVVAHEWGHLKLGASAFASTNPDDPAHSLDPRSVMFSRLLGDPTVVPGCAVYDAARQHHLAKRRHHRRPNRKDPRQ